MNGRESFLYSSSVRSYKDIGLSPSNDNLIKYMQNKDTLDKSSEEHESRNPPIMKRNQSYNAFNSTVFDRPSLQRREPSKQNIQKANIYTSFQKGNSQLATLQAQITRCASNEIILKTQKQLLGNQNRRLKEQIQYLRQKQQELNHKSEELIKCQSKITILERQYNRILHEYQQSKTKFNGTVPKSNNNSQQIKNNLRAKIENQYREGSNYQMPDYQKNTSGEEEITNNIPESRTLIKTEDRASQKVNWKRVSGAATSPIQKITNSEIKINQGTVLEIQEFDVKNPISRKINRPKGGDHSSPDSKERFNERQQQSSSSIYNSSDSQRNDRTVEHKYMRKLKQLQKKLKAADTELKNLRLKNIDLYGKSEEWEAKKIQYIEQINQLRYQKSKQLAQLRQRQEENRIKLYEAKKELENTNSSHNKIETMNKTLKDELRTMKEETTLIEQKGKELEKRISQLDQEKKKDKILLSKYQQIEDQLSSLKKQQEKITLEQTQTIKKEENLRKIQSTEEINTKLKAQREGLTQQLMKLQQECYAMQAQLQLLREQNRLQLDNVVRLTKMIQQQRLQNMRLSQLGNSWNELQRHSKMMKHMSTTIDHLWEIKQVEYNNINELLQQLHKIIG